MSNPTIAITSGDELADYHFGEQHPFGPQRHQAFLEGMKAAGLDSKVTWLDPVQCHFQTLLSFHTAEYIEKVKHGSELGEGYLDHGDTPARQGIFEAASFVVGSVVDMVDRIVDKQFRRGFIPIAGLHHGYKDHCSGFCIFNDCAIAIERLRSQHQIHKILYVDIDAHHGDGVYYNYESDINLCVVDFHEDGKYLYPGTGDADETGTGPAKGCKMNIPLPMQANDDDFAKHWSNIEKFIHSFKPEFIILQCGADSMKGDPITHLEFTPKSYRLATQSLCRIADEYCEGRIIALGGGGYNMENISKAWPAVVESLIN